MIDESIATEHSSIGAALRSARIARGLKLEDVSVALKLQAARVHALETDAFSAVGPAIYVRGFVRSYARLVGLPERGFDEALLQHFQAEEPELAPSRGARRSVNWGERYSRTFSYLVGTALVLTLIWTVVGFERVVPGLEERGETTAARASLRATEPADTDAVDERPLFATGLEPVLETPVVATEPAPAALALARGAGQPTTSVMASLTPFSGPATAAAGPGLLLSLQADSWTEITDAQGRRVIYDTLRAGQHRIAGEAPLVILLGNAGAAELNAAGRSIDLTPFMRANVARFKLEARGDAYEAQVAEPR